MIKPMVFIGSSTEQLRAAQVLRECLRPFAQPTLWNEPAAFELNESVFGGLVKAADRFDFAVFIFDADDLAQIRRSQLHVVRDNVLFEFGLFTGRIGRGRTFRISAQEAPTTHIPTDLAGIVSLVFSRPTSDGPEALRLALSEPCARLRLEFERHGVRTDHAVDELDINSTRILCAASLQYSEPRFAEDIRNIQKRFPSIRSAHGVDAEALLDELSSSKWDIIHLAMYVEPASGDVIVPRPSTSPKDYHKQRLPMAGLADLIQRSSAKLIVVVTCDSLVLGARLARFTNAIAGHKAIDARMALDWSGVFYRFLAEGCPLSEAFNRAQLYTDPGLLLLARRDFRLTSSSDVPSP